MSEFIPGYLRLTSDTLRQRAEALYARMRSCDLCPRNCGVNRLDGGLGACRVGAEPVVSSYGPHFGEESPLVGSGGSGTVFLTHCNLKCLFCQNYDISQLGEGTTVSIEALTRMMLDLQGRGCHNINWVTPTHQVAMLVGALQLARERGLHVPIVYNCGGYESVETLRLLDEVVDIYMPDAKYGDNAAGRQLSGVPDYWDCNRKALAEMHAQVGDLQIDPGGIATRGLLVRHLVLPSDMAKTTSVMAFLASLSSHTYVNVMAQYRPLYRAAEAPAINRPLSSDEYQDAVEAALAAGLGRLDDRWRRW